jgi:hypothetical protein
MSQTVRFGSRHCLEAVIAQPDFEAAEGALPREETQQRQYFTFKKTNPVQAPKLPCLTTFTRLSHRPEKLRSFVRGNHLRPLAKTFQDVSDNDRCFFRHNRP